MTDGVEGLAPVIKVLQQFAQWDVKMQLSTVLTLLYVAKYQDRPDGVTSNDLTKWIGITNSAASRNTYYWSDGTPEMTHGGYKLITVTIDKLDRRRRNLRLTKEGEVFISRIKEIMDGAT